MKMKIKGAAEFSKALGNIAKPADVQRLVKKNATELKKAMQQDAKFTQGYSTGATKRSIVIEMRDGKMSAAVIPKTDYAPFLINGTRHAPAQDFLRPALYRQRIAFLNDMNKLLKQ